MRKYFFYIILFFLLFFTNSQTDEFDLGAWLSVGCNIRFHQKHQVNTMVRFRQYEYFTDFNSWFYDIGYQYRVSGEFRVALHYAFNPSKTNENYFRNFHQYYVRMNYLKRINKYFSLNVRGILQHTTHLFITDFHDNGYRPFYRTDLRLRPGILYNISSTLNLFLQNEVLFVISRNPAEFRRNRFNLGVQKKLNKKINLTVFVLVQSIFNRRNSPDMHQGIIGLDLNYFLDLR
ncbi:MAG: DUF2490 domain-containing protein [Bacteroidia bacterium]|nr:DUF2490 domain-containing protein [Bacteroidia bacterium]